MMTKTMTFMQHIAGTYKFDPSEQFVIRDHHHNVICCTLINPNGVVVSENYLLYAKNIPFIIFCHDNVHNIVQSFDFCYQLSIKLGCYCLVFDYIGYGQSGNTKQHYFANENSACISIQLVIDHVINMMNVPPKNMLLYGQGIGVSVATYGMRYVEDRYLHSIGALILMDVYISTEHHFYQRLNTIENISYCKSPLCIIHCDNDIPITYGHQLFSIATCPKTFYVPSDTTYDHFNVVALCHELSLFLSMHVEDHLVEVESYRNITPRDDPNVLYVEHNVMKSFGATYKNLSDGISSSASSWCMIF